jgi:hypothetical protein
MSVHDASAALPRVRLQTAAAALRVVAARPRDDGPPPDGPRTDGAARERLLADALQELQEALDEHVRDAEADDGFLARLVADAPWIAPRAEQLRRDHAGLVRDCSRLVARAGEGADADLREDARRLARRADDHHHRGTALLLDAYELDISASD